MSVTCIHCLTCRILAGSSSSFSALYVQNKLEVLCKYLMANIVWTGSYSDCTVRTVTLSVGIRHRLFNRTLISHLNMYVTVPLTAQYSIHCASAQDDSLTLYYAC